MSASPRFVRQTILVEGEGEGEGASTEGGGHGTRASLNCGLLCRMLGARFAAATSHTVLATIGTHSNTAAVSVRVALKSWRAEATVSVRGDDGQEHVTKTNREYSALTFLVCDAGAARDVAFTSAVARWLCPCVMRVTFVRVPRCGLRGCTTTTSRTLACALFTFVGAHDVVYVKESHVVTGVLCAGWGAHERSLHAVFWPRHITVSIANVAKLVHVPLGVETTCSNDGWRGVTYTDTTTLTQNNLDEMIAMLCQSADTLLTATK